MRKYGRKRMLAIMMAAAMAVSAMGSMTAFAAPFTVNIVDKLGNDLSPEEIKRIFGEDPTFTAYRVFDGEDDGGKLVNIVWNADFKGLESDTTLTSWLTPEEIQAGATTITAEQVALHLQNNKPDADLFAKTVKGYVNANITGTPLTVGSNNDLAAGYYLIVNTKKDGQMSAVENPVLMEVTSDREFNITVKTDSPTVEKKVWEENKGLLEDKKVPYVPAGDKNIVSGQWNDVADFDIGDSVPFKLTAKIPAYTTNGYTEYKIRLEDTIDSNLKLNGDYQVFYKIGDASYVEYDFQDDLVANANGFTLQIDNIMGFPDFEVYYDVEVYVLFTATLTSGAVAADGEENAVKLYFTNSSEDDGEGETEKDVVVALTFDTTVDKWADVNGTHTSLDGVEFKLYQVDGAAPADLRTEVVDQATKTYDLPDTAKANLTEVTFTKENDRYVVAPKGSAVFTTTGNNFAIHGLDRATYILVETKAKAGYNILKEAVKVDLYNVDAYNRDSYTSSDYQIDEDKNPNPVPYVVKVNGVSAADKIISVQNKSGSELPETGGTGTMVLYLAGTALMAGGVFFLTSRRKKENED